MTTWTPDELDRIGRADDLQKASRRRGATLRRGATTWIVRAAAELCVRSADGPQNAWFRRAPTNGAGHVSAAA